VAYSNNGSLTS